MTANNLDLSAIVARRTVTLPGGNTYDLLGRRELSVWDAARLESKIQELTKYDLTKTPSDAQRRTYSKALRDVVGTIAPTIETKVLGKLSDTELLSIFGHYIGDGADESGGGSGNAGSARTTGASSRASNGSTAATRKRGSTSRSSS